jgi:hypothetical protein
MFGRNKEEKQARQAAAQAEIGRLGALPPEALAVEVLPVLARTAAERGGDAYIGMPFILFGLDANHDAGAASALTLTTPVRDALQRLEHANLVERKTSGMNSNEGWRVTALGQQSLAAGDVAARLARAEA